VIPAQAIRPEEPENPDQNQLVRYDFSSDQSGSVRHVAIYTLEVGPEALTDSKEYVPEHESVSRVLVPSRLWQDSFGAQINVSIDRGCRADPPMFVFLPIVQPPALPK
jgi:hypothetical protein